MTTRESLEALRAAPPFDTLSDDELGEIAAASSTRTLDKGDVLTDIGIHTGALQVISSGRVEIGSATGKVFSRLGPGGIVGLRSLTSARGSSYRAVVLEPSAVLEIPAETIAALLEKHPGFASQVEPVGPERFLAGAAADVSGNQPAAGSPDGSQSAGIELMTRTASDLMTAEPITGTPDITVLDAAQIMRRYNISCLPVVVSGRLVGIVTDGDLRDRVLAEGKPTATPLSEVMTADPITLQSDALAFDALVTMIEKKISHLPVVEGGSLVGILTHTNLVLAQARSAIYMIGEIHRLSDPGGMAGVVRQIPQLLVSLVDSGASAYKIGHIITSIADACTIRLLELAENKLGPPPVPYLWLACGSQGRREQTGVSDQDNCLFLHDSYVEAAHGRYFEDLANFVCDGLNTCGYVYCPGEMMATNPKWRQPLKVWKGYYRSWIDNPGPMAQMLASVMFDLRPIAGDFSLAESVSQDNRERARNNSIFVAHMVSNALTHKPPLGMFGNLTTTKAPDGRNAIDMKHAGVVPIVDIARVYALTAAIAEVNTTLRLEAGRSASVLSENGARDLLAAFEFIALTRLRHQARQIREGKKPDNFLPPNAISPLERTQLKDTFQVVKTIQSALSNARQIGAR